MAEIPIQPKHDHGGTSWWPWVLGALVLALIAWGITSHRRHRTYTAAGTYDTTTTPGTTSTPGMATPAPAVGPNAAGAIDEFNKWVSTGATGNNESAQQQYTGGGIQRLAAALASLGASGAAIDNMKKQGDALQSSTTPSTSSGEMTRSAFLSAGQAFDSLKASHPGLNTDMTKLHAAAQAMKTGPHLLGEKDQIQGFFEAARDALQGMTQSTR